LVVGAIAGSVAGMLLARRREGYGHVRNLVLGLVGALVGGGLFRLLRINLGLGSISVSLEDLVSALVGALVFMGAVALIQRLRGRK
jgi:uncharacterized membrane protein YeaQ/YmgE (transglycosylase-associated protein family)